MKNISKLQERKARAWDERLSGLSIIAFLRRLGLEWSTPEMCAARATQQEGR